MYRTKVFYFESIEQDVELEFDVVVDNDGIGSYEYWGSREYDHGNTTVEVDGYDWDRHVYTEEENKKIEAEYQSRQKEIEDEVIKEYLKEDNF